METAARPGDAGGRRSGGAVVVVVQKGASCGLAKSCLCSALVPGAGQTRQEVGDREVVGGVDQRGGHRREAKAAAGLRGPVRSGDQDGQRALVNLCDVAGVDKHVVAALGAAGEQRRPQLRQRRDVERAGQPDDDPVGKDVRAHGSECVGGHGAHLVLPVCWTTSNRSGFSGAVTGPDGATFGAPLAGRTRSLAPPGLLRSSTCASRRERLSVETGVRYPAPGRSGGTIAGKAVSGLRTNR